MDAVFIFIFFLLMSAQFIDIYEIASDAPSISMISEENKRPPLNLVLDISRQKIVIKTGLDGAVFKTVKAKHGKMDLDTLYNVLVSIKTKNIREESIILRPVSSVPYNSIVKIMDTVSKLKNSKSTLAVKDHNGNLVKTNKLFNQIIFETII